MSNDQANEVIEQTLAQKTEAILSTLTTPTAPETTVLINLVTLLLEEIGKTDIAPLKGQLAIQKTVTDRLEKENKRLKRRNDDLEDRLADIEEQVDSIEQHGRNMNLCLKGVPEAANEESRKKENTTKIFVDSINKHYPQQKQLTVNDIARTHRLGEYKPKNQRKPRPIIARFVRETKKMATFRVKKNLKGKGISLTENLTRYRSDLYWEAQKKLGYQHTWTWEGRVMANVNEETFQIFSYDDIPEVDEGDRDLF